ncbi:MAG: hypothetical protein PHU06_13530 [Gallionella sp.]|nr:hypothetical protein [Gallionella sp.]MDD4959927.1 hypothetical protein [Gallionella sp.]
MLFSSSHSRPRYTQLIGSADALALAQKAALVVVANALAVQ